MVVQGTVSYKHRNVVVDYVLSCYSTVQQSLLATSREPYCETDYNSVHPVYHAGRDVQNMVSGKQNERGLSKSTNVLHFDWNFLRIFHWSDHVSRRDALHSCYKGKR